MIVAEEMAVTATFNDNNDMFNTFDRFGEFMPDGRLTEQSSSYTYRLRDAILLSRQLGRPLSEQEMKQFEV